MGQNGLYNRAKRIWTLCNDFALNIRTMMDEVSGPEGRPGTLSRRGEKSPLMKYDDGSRYQSIDYWYIRKLVRILNPGPDEVVYDLGSGKGRVLCVFAQRRVRGCVGVEILESLCEISNENAAHLRRRKSAIDIVCGDAARIDLSDGTIYIMFNPFGANTLREVVTSIQSSLVSNPRRIRIVYYNAVHEDVLKSFEWLHIFHVFDTLTRIRVSFWSNFESSK